MIVCTSFQKVKVSDVKLLISFIRRNDRVPVLTVGLLLTNTVRYIPTRISRQYLDWSAHKAAAENPGTEQHHHPPSGSERGEDRRKEKKSITVCGTWFSCRF
ncbi:unnamed protein product [Musa hybrid cultivar]